MEELFDVINNLKKSEVNTLVESRINEFNEIKSKSHDKIFGELCFCIMTANCSAKKCIEIQKSIGDGFNILPEKKLAHNLKEFDFFF